MSVILKTIYCLLSVTIILSVSFLRVQAHGSKNEKKIQNAQDSHWSAPKEQRNRINPVKDVIQSAKQGQRLYIDNCMNCHGPDGEGDGQDAKFLDSNPSDLKAMAGHHPDGDMAWKIKNGKGDMPAWGDVFTQKQIWDLVNFLQNLEKKP